MLRLFLCFGLLGMGILLATAGRADYGASPQINIATGNLTATDNLGRTLPTYAEVGAPKPNRWVGLFYWQWHGNLRCWEDYDITKWLKWHPGYKDWVAFRKDGPQHPTWFWAEPLFGYYKSTDPWVIRRHLAMFAAAGVDFLFLDYTNSGVYDEELDTLLKVARDLKSQGLQIPRLVFFLNFQPEWKIEHLYLKYYKPGKWDDMWFQWYGKPLVMSPKPEDASKLKEPALLGELQDYFTWRPTWANQDAAKEPHKWRFIDVPPQRPALGPDGQVEQLVVCKSMGGPIWDNMQTGSVSCVPGHVPEYNDQWVSKDAPKGLFFAAGWQRAEEVAPPILLVTGWNEWTASVWEQPGVVFLNRKTKAGQGYIVDEFNMEFNRDLEPMKGGYFDNYYWQFVSEMRRYKGMLPPEPASAAQTINVDGKFAEWKAVRPRYTDPAGETTPRDWPGEPPDTHYTVTSGRNDFVLAQVAHDQNNLYFHVRCAKPLSPATGKQWMMLLIDADADPSTGWHGYDFLVNRLRKAATCSVQRNVGGKWEWDTFAAAPIAWQGWDLELALPRHLLGLEASQGKLHFNFKWVDNLPARPQLADLYIEGDVAPDTRFAYVYFE